MRINNWSGLYVFGYLLVSTGIGGFYRRFEVEGKENLPVGKPVLFAANHQNAFLDGAVIAYAISKPIYFLGRSDIFSKRVAKWVLGELNCLPIYREKDGVDTIKMNNEIFDTFYDILQKNRPMVIFPEGNQGDKKQLRGPVKKGVFRIAVGAESKYNKKLDVHIVPVGIDYEKQSAMGGDLLVSFGKPIRILDHIGKDAKEQGKIYTNLIADLEERISALMIDIQERDHYEMIYTIVKIFSEEIIQKENVNTRRLLDTVNAQKSCIARIEQRVHDYPDEAAEIKGVAEDLSKGIENLKLRSWLLQKDRHTVVFQMLLLVLLTPIHIYGMLNSYLPYKLPVWLVERKFKDQKFHASIKVITGALMFLLFWTLQTALVFSFSDHCLWVLYVVSLPLSAFISYFFWIQLLKLKGKHRYNKYMSDGDLRTMELHKQYNRIKDYLNSIYDKK
jgi:1-acyl-sn-glycerol-3-phosphate acyltransferase